MKEYKAELQNYKQNSANLMNVVFEQHIAQIVRHEIQPSLQFVLSTSFNTTHTFKGNQLTNCTIGSKRTYVFKLNN